MRFRLILCHVFLFCAIALSYAGQAKERELDFITNGRQWPAPVRYKADLPGGSVFLTNTGFTYSYYSTDDLSRIHELRHDEGMSTGMLEHEPVRCHAYSVTMVGCNSKSLSRPQQRLPHYYNYFQGKDPSRWSGGMAAYERVDYEQIYQGIDLHVYSKGHSFKYDFVVAPGATVSAIQLAFEGVTPRLNQKGDLLIQTSVNELLEQAPYAYQVINGKQQQVTCSYVVNNSKVGFAFPNGYDHTRQLVIDPVLVFATYSGGTTTTFGWSATYDSSGNLYAGGECFGTGWPTTLGAFQTTFGGIEDIGINKYSSNGSTLIYSSYYGGSGGDNPNAMLVNPAGELILAGATSSTDLAVTAGCYDNTFNGGVDLYIARFNAAGSALLGATYLGGSDTEGIVSTSLGVKAGRGEIVIDSSGNIYVAFASKSIDFPVTAGAYQSALSGPLDAVVAKVNASCSNLLFSTYLGGSGRDAAITMELGPHGNLLIGGATSSNNFPGTSSGWQSSNQGGLDGFIAVLNNQGSALIRATYVGSAGDDEVSKLYLDKQGSVYATGSNINGSFPVSAGVYNAPGAPNYIAKFDSTLATKNISTTIGDSAVQFTPTAFMVDNCSNVYFIGYGNTRIGLPLTSDAFQTTRGSFWMCVLNPNLVSIRYASFIGALGDHIDGGSSRLSPDGVVFHSVCTSNPTGLPTSPSVWSPTKQTATFDIASWKFAFQYSGMKAGFSISPNDSICAPGVVSFTNSSTGALSYLWDFGDGTATSNLADPPPHTYTSVGTYKVTLTTYNVASCQLKDSAFRFVYVYRVRDSVKLRAPDSLNLCAGDTTRMQVDPKWTISVSPASGVSYKASGGNTIMFYPSSPTSYEVSAVYTGPCGTAADTIRFVIAADTAGLPGLKPMIDTLLCKGDTAIYILDRPMRGLSIIPADFFAISSDSMSLRFFPPVTTSYRLVGQTFNRCLQRMDTLKFSIQRSAVKAAFELSPKATDLQAPEMKLLNKSLNAVSYNWYLNDVFWTTASNPTYTATDTGTYCFRLEAEDAFQCVDTARDCGKVFIPLIYVPSAFTPNGDQRNDVFRPVAHNLQIIEFSVYNRYGQRIFVTFDNRQGWDGTFNGEPCDLGTYFYMVRYRILEREPVLLKGDVTLVR